MITMLQTESFSSHELQDQQWAFDYLQTFAEHEACNEDQRAMITTFLQNESSSSHGDMTLMPKTAPILSPPLSNESEKLIKMKNRKMKKQARKDVKNVKQVIVTEGVTDEYNIDNILEELGEVGNIFYRNILF